MRQMMGEKAMVAAGAVNMFIAVAAGAFGAHGLKRVLSPEMLAVWQTAVHYQMAHALGLLALAALVQRMGGVWVGRAGSALLCGIVLFCGSLYALALGGPRLLGALAPVGGLSFLLGWAMLAWSAWRACVGGGPNPRKNGAAI